MLQSMTGFGRSSKEISLGRLTVEIQSVNRKYFEVLILAPKELSLFEHPIRKWVGKKISRGQLAVRLTLSSGGAKVQDLLPDPQVLKRLKKEWDQIALEAGLEKSQVTLPFLLELFPQEGKQVSEEDARLLEKCVQEALKSLVEMKMVEGKALKEDLSSRLEEIKKMLLHIEKQAPDASEKMKKNLFQKMQDLLKGAPEFEERLLREVALFAEKVDFSEEVVRFQSHIEQFEGLLSEEVVGRKMDFLIQEMGREINTIGSKSTDAKISHLVVSVKSELEKIREQVQNIE